MRATNTSTTTPGTERVFSPFKNVNPAPALRRAFAVNAPLAFVGVAMALTLLAALIGLVVDHQSITGQPAWLKPAKFCVSVAIYAFTFLWLLTFVQGRARLKATLANVTALAAIVEMGIIIGQVIRGTTSHFNFSTPLDAALFETMAGFIVLLWTMAMILAGVLLVQRLPDAAFAWSLRFGIILAVIGMAVAFLMTQPTTAQLAAANAGHGLPIIGAHSVGVADGGPGLPVLGWSTVGGDLRIPHFVGLHGLQVLPFLGWLLMTRFGWLGVARRVALIWTSGLTYLGVMLLLTWQALRAQSIVHPDALTLAAFGALALAALVATAIILLGGWRATAANTSAVA